MHKNTFNTYFLGLLISVLALCYLTQKTVLGASPNPATESKPDVQKIDSSALPADFFKTFTAPELRQELDSAVRILEQVHPNLYAYTSKSTFDTAVAEVRKSLDKPMTRYEFAKRLTPLVARLGCGHTFLYYREDYIAYRDNGGRLFPLETEIIEGRLFIKNNYSENGAVKTGAEILEINNIAAKTILADLIANQSDELVARKEVSACTGIRRELFNTYLWGTNFTVKIRDTKTNTIETQIVEGVSAKMFAEREKSKEQRDSVALFSYKELPSKIGYLTINEMISPEKREPFLVFLNNTFGEIKQKQIRALIIDVRRNSGGDSGTGDMIIDYLTDEPWTQFGKTEVYSNEYVKKNYGEAKYIEYFGKEAFEAKDHAVLISGGGKEDYIQPGKNPLRFQGEKYLLTSPYTFSSAYSFTTALKAFKIATLVGQETGGAYGGYGQCYQEKLPLTKLELWIATKRFFPPEIAGQKSGSALMPDYYVKSTVNDFIAGRDAALEKTLELIQSKP